MLLQRPFVAALLVAVGCLASPTPLEVSVLRADQTDALVQEGVNLAHTSQLERRLKADFSMAHSWDHQVLFHGDYAWNQEDANSAETVGLNITCIDCETKGSVTAKLWEDILHPSLRLQFNQVEAYILLGLNASASTTVSVNLFASNSPIGLHYPGLSVGVVFFVDLVFSLNATIDMSGGFYIKLADDAFLQADIFGGDVSDYFFDGASSKSLPITVATGSGATFKADLRLRVQVGAEAAIDTFGIGAGAAMGIYANLVEFVAEIETTPTCALETREWFDLNAGAYARLDVVVDYKTLGLVPTVSTTLLSAPTLTQCWIPLPALPMISSSLPANPSSGRMTVSGSSQTASSSSATIPTSTVSPAALSSLSSAASITAKYETSATVLTPLSSASSSFSSVSASLSLAASLPASSLSASSLSASTLPSAASVTPKISGFSATVSPPLATAVPSLAASLNGTGRYPMLNASSLTTNETNLVTTTLYSTAAYTITMCAAGVPNCPAAYQSEVAVTKTVDSYTTVCPAGAQVTWPAAGEVGDEAASSSAAASVTSHHVVTQVIAMTKVPSPKPETFVPPVPAPTMPAVAAAAVVAASGSAAPKHPAAAAAYAAFVADYGVDNARHRNGTLATPSSSSSSSGSNHQDHPMVAVDGSSRPVNGSESLASFKHENIAQNPNQISPEGHMLVTAGGVVSYAGNIGLVLGSIMVTIILLG
ncbi:hypothetical protein PG994_004006 [Apiospora phragmitis]|uniref:Uncharacterized protein n=1 Tax=Apiospora phragmitis TaxID=2905665 RepID=A0ABR1VZQ8_9PEZI